MQDLFEPIVTIILLIIFSIFGRILLEKIGQRWVTTFAHTTTIILLPVITFMITKVIAGNIALSLGMVGALSIVRFRNPVRSPLELSVYFACITMGIAASVHIRWLFYFVIAILLVSACIKITSILMKRFNKEFFNISFSEGNSTPTLEIESKKEIDKLDESKFLISKSKNNEIYYYTLASSNFNDLKLILNEVKKNDNLENYQIRTS